ncbi:ABC transporter [Colletotrichum orchidophilum]|uniref:ABC transporter n=1 Tax=Colletotrichum orchidophilum TaxID=1209926 RepID=A0A1G4AZA7_9PEZI|nr:ABC transporter [Colletotrichum orchidophilum]OHE94372.1 ABC transporter [Colletotrichum orchidophilum]
MTSENNQQAVAMDAFACSSYSTWAYALCHQGLDPNTRVEEITSSIIPCSIALIWGLHRRRQLQTRAVVSHGSLRPVANLISLVALSFLLLLFAPITISIVPIAVALTSGIILWQVLAVFQIMALITIAPDRYGQSHFGISLASWILSVATSVLFILISEREHSRSLAPSALLQLFLLVTVFLDVARVRTAWLLSSQINNEGMIAMLLTVQVALKVLLLLAESASKPTIIAIPARRVSREETAGIFGKSFATWINPLLRLGWKKDLVAEDLDPLDEALDGEVVLERLSLAWKNVHQEENHALVVAVLKAFHAELLFIHIPRVGMVAFGLAQPLLVQTTIEYMQNHNDKPVSYGHALVGAFALTYLGLAISTRWSGQLTHRLITRIRGALIAKIYQNMLTLRAETDNSQAAVALMSTEVERITVAAQFCVAIVPNLIQLGFAMWIMSEQLGAVSVAPIIIALLSVSAGIRTGQLIPPRQRRWMQAIQKRVGITTEIIGSVKGVKMSGLTNTVQDQIQGLRDFELDESKKFRRVQILNVLIGQFPSIMTPSITFAAFAIISKVAGGNPLNAVQAFTSLSLLGILISPVSELVMIPNNLGAAIGCLDRIQEYLTKEKREDYRLVKSKTPLDPVENGSSNGTNGPSQTDSQLQPLIKVSNGSFGWHTDQAILKSLDLEIPPASLTILVGPVGSGKSTLLKSLVGETYRISGSVEYTISTDVAYCDQDPWILNQSVKENITGGSVATHDETDFYNKVIRACQLEEDLDLLPQGDETVVGSSGSALSGGQKHRIALARAVYSGKQIIIMDDNLKGLDSKTASKCFNALFGGEGLLRGRGRAIIFATHNAQWLRSADNIISLGSDGTISETGLYKDLCKTGGYVSTLKVTQQSDESVSVTEAEETQEIVDKKAKAVAVLKPDDLPKTKSRGAANTSSLLYYIKSMGITSFGLFISMVIFQTICRIMQRLWVKFWVAANEDGGQENLGMWVGVYILWGILTELAVAMETYYFLVVIVPHSAKGLHFSVLKAALAAPLSFFVKTDTGIIINRFSQDMNLVDLPLPLAFMLTFDNLTLAIADITLTTLATPYLSLSIPFLALTLHLLQRTYLQTSRQIRLLDLETKSPLFSHFIASAAGLATIRALGDPWTARVRHQNLRHLDLSQRAFYAMGSLQKWLLLVLNLVVAALAVLLVASAVALRNTVDAGLLGVALVSVMTFGQLLTQLLNYWAQLETSLGAVARIREFEAETPSEEGTGDGGNPAAKEAGPGWPLGGRIAIRNVSAAYDDHQVLSGVNISIEPGEKVAICGRTGSGKSTLLALLLRLHDPSAGAIEVDGVDIRSVPVTQLRESLVALPQDPLFLPGTVRRNLDPFMARGDDDDVGIWDALEKTGLKALFEDKGGLKADLNTDWLSAGQKQLFCMARAILRDSRVLLLDEATSSLDQATEQLVQDLIASEFRGWTIIVIAHRLRAVVDFDKIVTLQDGRVVEFDSPKKLLENGGAFAAMWKIQEG